MSYEYFVQEVSYKYQFEPPKSRDFDRLVEAEVFARDMRARGYDCYIFKDQKRVAEAEAGEHQVVLDAIEAHNSGEEL